MNEKFVVTMDATRGAPPATNIPTLRLSEVAEDAILEKGNQLGPYTGGALGYLPLREYFAGEAGVPVENVFISQGGMMAWEWFLKSQLAAKKNVSKNDPLVVGMPRLVYDRAQFVIDQINDPVAHFGVKNIDVVFLTEHADGIDLSELEKVAPQIDVLYAVPTFSNPTGAVWSEENRLAVLALARENRFMVAEDDPYRQLFYFGEPPASFFDLSGKNPTYVFQMNSLSKVLNIAGMRICWSVCDDQMIKWLQGDPQAPAKIFISQPITGSLLLEHLLSRDRNFIGETSLHLREEFGPVVRDLGYLIPARLGNFLRLHAVPKGGYFLWLNIISEKWDAVKLILAAQQIANLKLQAGRPFHGDQSDPEIDKTVRVAFPGIIEAGGAESFVRRLEYVFKKE